MATFDQLSDEQRAIIELILEQGKSYDELSDMLELGEARVRELARDALVELAPISARGVDQDWRGQLADYVLGQQVGPEATATRGHLRRSEAARSWTRSLLDSLERLYPDGSIPAIPEGERGRERGSRRAAAAAPGAPADAGSAEARALTPEAAAAVKRRRIVSAAGVGLLIVLAVLLWPIGVLTGGDDDEEPSRADSGTGTQRTGNGGQTAGRAQGEAIILEQRGRRSIVVRAAGLDPGAEGKGYQAWLYNSDDDRKSLGATVADQQGGFQAIQNLPRDFEKYRFVDVSEVTIEGRATRNGPSVLRGLLELSERPVTQGSGKNKVTVLAQIRMLPLPGSDG